MNQIKKMQIHSYSVPNMHYTPDINDGNLAPPHKKYDNTPFVSYTTDMQDQSPRERAQLYIH